jgi:hypothetical protein
MTTISLLQKYNLITQRFMMTREEFEDLKSTKKNIPATESQNNTQSSQNK